MMSFTATVIVLKQRMKLKAENASTQNCVKENWQSKGKASGGNIAHFSFYLLYALALISNFTLFHNMHRLTQARTLLKKTGFETKASVLMMET